MKLINLRLGGAALAALLAIVGTLAGCKNPASESPAVRETGRVVVSLGIAGSAAPVRSGFTNYELRFTPTGAGEAQGPVAASDGSAALELVTGTYTLSARAYTGTDGSSTVVAIGELPGVTVKSGQTTEAALTLVPKTGGPNGTLSYAITIPQGLTASDTAIITAAGGTMSNGELSLTAGQNTGTRELAPGFYKVRGVLSKGAKTRNMAEDVVIYTGLTSTLEKAYSSADLSGEDENPSPPLTVGLGITIGFIDYDGEISIGGNSGTNTIFQDGNPSTLVLSAPAGYTNMAWYIDGGDPPVSTALSLTLEAAAYDVRNHSVTFTGFKEGRPYSQTLSFTVEEAEPGNNENDDGVSAAGLATYLAGLPGNTVNTPHTVVFASSVTITGNEWGTTIKNALAGSPKYVILDLSACSAPNNQIIGTYNAAGNSFNAVRTNCIVGVILPSSLTKIGDYAFYEWTALRSITIPSGLVSIGESAFESCTYLSSITIPAGVMSIGGAVFRYCTNLTSVTIPDSVTSIGNGAFSGCSGLSGITIPNGLSAINTGVFSECSGLTSVTIPAGVTSIAAAAFDNCSSLISVTFAGNTTTIQNGSFDSGASLKSVYDAQETKVGTYVRNGSSWTKQ